jgi:hypothetical protein
MQTMKGARSPTPPMPGAAAVPAIDIDDIEHMLVNVAEKYNLSTCERMLVDACVSALKGDAEGTAALCERTAARCTQARITREDIQAHTDEIGVHTTLTSFQTMNVHKFAHFMQLLEKMEIIEFEGNIAGRTLLGYAKIRVMQQEKWQAVIEAACGAGNRKSLKYFAAKSSIYDMMLKFGFGGKLHALLNGGVRKSSTEKKVNVLLNSRIFSFRQSTMAHNLKRYTNSNNRVLVLRTWELWHALLEVAERELYSLNKTM